MRTALLLAVFPLTAFAQVPVTFESGTPARAAEVNQNFQALDARITETADSLSATATENYEDLDARINSSIGGIIISGVTASDGSGVVAAVCPSDRIAISANCLCDNESGTRNFGVLFGCQVAGNGGAVGCFPEGTTFDPLLPAPMAHIVVGCISAVKNDGTKLEPTPIVLKPGQDASNPNITSLNAADDLNSTVNAFREQAAIHLQRLNEQQ